MFERIKCYRSIKKYEAVARGMEKLGQYTNDEEMIRVANEVFDSLQELKRKMWLDRKIAKGYNSKCKKAGF